MAAHSGPDIIQDGLVFYVDAANTKSYPGSGTTWFDLSGNGKHATLTGSPTFNSAGYFDLDGTDDFAAVTIATGTTRTVSHWFRQNSSGSGRGPLWRTNDWRERIFSTQVLLVDSGGNYHGMNFSSALGTDELVNICYSFNGTSAKCYVNGELDATTNLTTNMNTGTYTYNFGRQASGSTTTFQNEEQYSIAFYDAELTAAQVKQNFNAVRGRFPI